MGYLFHVHRRTLSPFDHGFLYGYGLFETMRADNGAIFRLDRHLARLRGAAEMLGIHSQLASIYLEKACYDTLNLNKLTDARLRLAVSAGEGDITPNPATCKQITVFIAARPLTPLSPENYQKGFRAAVSSLRRNSQSPLSRLKTSCYLENILARQEARAKSADEAIMLNETGMVAEGSSSNIFCISDSVLLTPSIDCGALPGITREAVLELAPALGIRVKETELMPQVLLQAEEAFFTNAVIEIMPLTYIDDRQIGTGKAGAVTHTIMRAYRKLVVKSQTKGKRDEL